MSAGDGMRVGDDVVEILRKLVGFATPSAKSNVQLIEWVSAWLEPLGWQVMRQRYRDECGVDKVNLVARPVAHTDESVIDFAFVCHSDTVPFAAEWAEALLLVEREGMLHGLGACDVKGSLACFLAAAAETDAGNIALVVTADEEVGCRGVERLLAEHPMKIARAIVSEPTNLRPGVAGKGYGLARVVVRGREAHSAFPTSGVSAISAAAKMITDMEQRMAAAFADESDGGLFSPAGMSWNVGVIRGGTAKNIIAGECEFLVEWRSLPDVNHAHVVALLGACGDALQQERAGVVVEVTQLRGDEGFSPATGSEFVAWLKRELGTEATGISFGSEATRIARFAREVVVMGPGDMRTAHSERECVPLAELERWTKVLTRWMANPGEIATAP